MWKHKFPLFTLTIGAGILYLSFFTPPSVPMESVIGIDKLVHIAMYAIWMSVAIWELRNPESESAENQKFILLSSAMIIFSGAVEIAQEYLTHGRREGDWWDFLANTVGIGMVFVVYFLYGKYREKTYRSGL